MRKKEQTLLFTRISSFCTFTLSLFQQNRETHSKFQVRPSEPVPSRRITPENRFSSCLRAPQIDRPRKVNADSVWFEYPLSLRMCRMRASCGMTTKGRDGVSPLPLWARIAKLRSRKQLRTRDGGRSDQHLGLESDLLCA
jgi:hypothetical protein